MRRVIRRGKPSLAILSTLFHLSPTPGFCLSHSPWASTLPRRTVPGWAGYLGRWSGPGGPSWVMNWGGRLAAEAMPTQCCPETQPHRLFSLSPACLVAPGSYILATRP